MRRLERFGAVLDFDGLLTPNDAVPLVRLVDQMALPAAGAEEVLAVRERYRDRADEGNLSRRDQEAWLTRTARVYARHRLTLARAWEILDAVSLRPGVADALERLQRAGGQIAIVSYGFHQFIRHVLMRHRLLERVDRIYAGRLVTEDGEGGRIMGVQQQTLVVPETKGAASHLFAQEFRVPCTRLIGAGDSMGDVRIGCFRRNRLGVGSTPEKAARLSRFMGDTMVVDREFTPVTDWIFRRLAYLA